MSDDVPPEVILRRQRLCEAAHQLLIAQGANPKDRITVGLVLAISTILEVVEDPEASRGDFLKMVGAMYDASLRNLRED